MTIPRQLPNAITSARIPLAILFVILLVMGGRLGADDLALRWIAAVLFVVGISTDWVDGYLARRHDIVTDLGKLLDPIADKLLTGAGFIGLAILGEVPWWMVIVMLIREWGITIHRLVIANEHVVAAAWMGKVKTLVQAVALSWALLPIWLLIGVEPFSIVTLVLMWLAVILTIASGIDYVVAQVRGARAAR
ncbi:CDP-diacylglycerol--glycerol-3-phosphate 3-phosphatidyltransferase [Microbacterium sp. MEC084]|uniref:CDP-diacylglycerol--glycerol-3-phosphate 3-phosphatidyltransferase n=1 Tax=unclassified Microbacterium TaxID=2609290 RepID=UPI0006F42060|nr:MULTISPECIES: CDP-diacylglycerol--glycerol-3-phosphate 3-phosphatidyltransferase [unclassified Microbacterium]KQY97079.1 CDP-diacylglycerol--glycerol-3-phosphate 3-phosphatidyltransferase [Microbacterium sp. Root53]MCD1268286.1 CDP-diacylglycerol--glycerol-3-phosphate 3-phosphatidyltransferase [Microbacterium sp. MEC084]